MPKYDLRPYQQEALDRLTEGWRAGRNRLAVVMATGAGKTITFGHAIRTTLPETRGRALVIAHRDELITQAAEKISAINPDLTVGVVKAERDEHQGADVIVASVQTLAVQRRREAVENVGLAIVDECHHSAAPTYRTVLDHYGAFRGLPVAGFTATLTRRDGGLADIWQDVVYRLDILDLIGIGALCDARGKRVVVPDLDLDGVRIANGDLQEGQLGEAFEDSSAARIIAEAYLEHAADRPGIVFTPTVAVAHMMAEVLNDHGIPAAAVWGAMPKDERAETLARYEAGEIQVLTNCMVLTEGFDAPWTSCVVIARPTASPSLYTQMGGRGLRLWPGKKDALILDVVGASTRHRLATIVDMTDRSIEQPADGQSLAEAAEEQERRGIEITDVAWEDVDLFHNSLIRWLKTDAGTWFVPTAGTFYFLEPGRRPGFYRIRSWTKDTGQFRDAPLADDENPLEYSMIRAEAYARRRAAALASKSSGWRMREPSDKLLGLARYHRIRLMPGWTAGDLSDAIDVRIASRAIDQRPQQLAQVA